MEQKTPSTAVEEWKSVVDYEGFYEVSNKGRVRSCDRMVKRSLGGFQKHKGKILNQHISKSKYVTVALSKYGVAKTFTVHIIEARAFYGEANGRVVDHIDRIRSNNDLSNLRYLTQRENVVHSRIPTSKMPTGVSLNPPIYKKRYRVRINIDGKLKDLGSYMTEQEAAEVYQNKFTQLINQ